MSSISTALPEKGTVAHSHTKNETMLDRPSCTCAHCKCLNLARIPTVYTDNSGFTSVEPQPTLCLRCERLELWGKNSPSYEACKCECRCQLQRAEDQMQCIDCLV
ncbi:hypothetical protein F5Y11DRAFT_340137 [Daldinia sp. FL1419]|nr:hypothetical protein F5Y11DRAFT_340137 [Daldinia sp. FL1419]